MKILLYKILQSEDENEIILSEVMLQWSEENEKIAKANAYEGKYTVEEIEMNEPAVEPTAQDDTDAMLIDHEYRLTLLELGLVE